MSISLPEPWLRGALVEVHPLVMPVFFSFAQVREDLAKHTDRLALAQTWRVLGGTSIGFHSKHMAGSVDRLTTYLLGHQLSEAQLESLRKEATGNEEVAELLRRLHDSLESSQQKLLTLDPQTAYEPRTVGRRALPTTVIGLIVHLAEHTQRHLGQAITISKFLRQD